MTLYRAARMLSMDLTSPGLGAGTWADRSWGVLGGVCCCVAGEAAGDCGAAAILQSERAAAIVGSLNFIGRPPLVKMRRETIPQRNGKCAANQPGPVRLAEFMLCDEQGGGGWG